MERILLTHSVSRYKVPHFVRFWFQYGLQPLKPVVKDLNGGARAVFIVVDPIGGKNDQFAVFFF